MVTQGLWQRDPVLMQLPHVTRELAAACAEKGACGCRRGWERGWQRAGRRRCKLLLAHVAAPHCRRPPTNSFPPLSPGVETAFDLMEMEDDARRELLQVGVGRKDASCRRSSCPPPATAAARPSPFPRSHRLFPFPSSPR